MDENLERITILLQAKDREFARAMDRNNKLISKFAKNAEQGTTRMSRGIQQNLDGLTASVKGFATGFVGGLAGGLVTSVLGAIGTDLRATVAGIAQVGDEAKRSGLGVQAFQEWSFVAQQNRVSIDALVDGFKELNLRADEWISTGAGPAAEAFARIGFSPEDLKARLEDPSALMLEIIGRLQELDQAAQIRVADEVFGGTGGEQFVQLIGQGKDGLQGLIDRAHEVGAVLDDQMIQKAQDLDTKFSEVATRLGSIWKQGIVGAAEFFGFVEDQNLKFFRSVSNYEAVMEKFGNVEAAAALAGGWKELEQILAGDDAVEKLEKIRAGYDSLQNTANRATSAMAGAVADVAERNALLAQALSDMSDRVDSVAASLASALAQGDVDAAEEYARQLGVAVDNLQKAVTAADDIAGLDLSAAVATVDGLASAFGRLMWAAISARSASSAGVTTGTPLSGPIDTLMPPTTDVVTTSPRPKPAPVDVLLTDAPGTGGGKRGGGGGGRTDRFADALTNWKVEAEGILAEAEALNALALSFDEYGISVDVARRKAELLQEAKEAGKEITPQLRAEIDALAASYANAATEMEKAKQRHDEFKAAVDEAKGSMKDAFVGLVTGANSFRDALSNVIGKLAEMLAAKAFEGLWGAGLGSATGGFLQMLGFSSGGYTGPGGRKEPAGIVHKGEVVFSQDDVARSGGVAAVEAMRRNGVSRAVAPSVASGGGSTGSAITVTAYTDESVILDIAGAAAVQQIRRAAPQIVQQSVAATDRAMSRTKQFGAPR